MKKLFSIFTILIILMFSLTACKIETASQHDARLAAESESLAKEQESLLAAQNNGTAGTNETQPVSQGETALSSSTNTTSSSLTSNTSTSNGSVSSNSGTTGSSDSASSGTTNSVSNTSDSSTASATTNVGSVASGTTDTTEYITVKLKISCYNIVQYASENSNINASGIIYENDNLILPKGSSVLTALKASNIPYNISGIYLSSINKIDEKQYGPESGWMYRVNGVSPNVGVKAYTLNGDDGNETIEFYYITTPSDN